jgi:hypothetical protein
MRDSKVFRFLSALQPKERRRFRKYLESPYFNSHAKLLRLYDRLEEGLTDPELDLSKEQLWECIHQNEPFEYDKLRKLLHVLMEHAYAFLSQQVFDVSIAAHSHYLLQLLAEKQMESYMPHAIESGMALLQREQNKNGNFYYDLYSIEKFKYVLADVESARVSKSNIQRLNLGTIDEHLNTFFLSEKLRNYCLILSWSKMIEMDTKIPLLEEVLQMAQRDEYKDIAPISIYYQIYRTYSEPDVDAHFIRLKELIRIHLHLFPANEARDIINAAINYTIQRQNRGQLEYAEHNFELWQYALDTGVILVHDEISPWAFKNIVTLALRLGRFDWTELFISDFGPKIVEEYRENAVNYNLASLHFYRKKYDRAIPFLQKVQFDEITYGLGAKSLLLACYFELDEFEPLFSHIESFKVFVRRNKSLTTDRKKRYYDLLRFVKRIIESSHNKKALSSLKEEIYASQVSSKNWLIEKVDELLS